MYKSRIYKGIGMAAFCLSIASCKVPTIMQQNQKQEVPANFSAVNAQGNLSDLQWRSFFKDKNLVNLIDTALKNNQELNMTLQEIEIAKSDVRFRNGQILPTVGAKIGLGLEKVGRYTSQGAGDASTEIAPGKEVPDPLSDYTAEFYANWEVDIWHKLHNAKKAAISRYLATIEGKNFVLSSLVAEVANSYYELRALDNKLALIQQTIELQKNALQIVKLQKEGARVSELAVQKFQAEVLNSESLEFDIRQNIQETENKINFLLGRFPQEIPRAQTDFLALKPMEIAAGIPAQLLENRPDIKQAELELAAAKMDVKVARAEFYPSLGISAAFGLQAFKPSYITKLPESMLYALAGDLVGPLINKNGIKAEFYNANAKQLQALYNYQKTILNAYLEVSNQLSKMDNLGKSYALKMGEVEALTKSITISNDLFKSARADYLEVLMTQRDALEAKLELIETKEAQLNAVTNVYRDLGGGWK